MGSFYVTTPIYYVNSVPHLGHAYTTIVADSMARFHRAMGDSVYFLTGTDEHGDKIVQAAEKAGKTPQEYVDEISGYFQQLWPEMKITNDDFIRTTQPRHKKVVQEVLQKVYDAGDIYKNEYGGHYCTGCERFLTEKELTEDGLCPDHLAKPDYVKEENYFFRMSKYVDRLIAHIEENPDFVRPERYRNEVLSLLKSGDLGDLCISRPKSRLEWGIELPFDKDYVCYVWFDALLNYVTALDWPQEEKFNAFWPSVNHLIAKDILKPHAIFWPTMLMSAGLPLYQHLNVHGYWLIKDTKMSKSLGNVIRPVEMAKRYGLDTFRYFLLREMHFGNDANFSEDGFVSRRNSDLANDFGNLVSRTLSMTKKYFKGVVPEGQVDPAMREMAENAFSNYTSLFAQFRFARSIEAIWELVRGLNKFIDEQQPWTLFKEEKNEELANCMYTVLELLRKIAIHLTPVMPDACGTMLEQLGQAPEADDTGIWAEAGRWDGMKPGMEVAAKSNLFPRVDPPRHEEADECEKKSKKQLKKEKAAAKKAEEKAAKDESGFIEFPDFQKVEMRVGTVLSVDKHPDADRLLLIKVDLGEDDPRQIVAGLADYFKPEDLTGRQVTVVANLKPRKLRGYESQGMILAVKTEEGMELLTPSGPAQPGTQVS